MGGYRQLPITPYEPQQTNLLQQLAGVQALKNAQAQNTALQQENEQRALALNDQKATTAAMHEWDGKDLAAIPPLMVKHGASANAVIGLKGKILEQQEKFSNIAKNDAETGSKNLETLKGKNDLVLGRINSFADVPDADLPKAIAGTAQEFGQNGTFDQNHVQQAAQLASLAQSDPQAARKQLSLLAKSMQSNSQQMEQALKTAQTGEAKARAGEAEANTKKIQSEMEFYQKQGLAPGVPLDAQEAADWMAKNKGKSLADFMKYKATLVPAFNFNLQQNTGAGQPAAQVAQKFGLTPEAFDQQAEKYWTTGQLPPTGRGGTALALNKALMNRAAELHPNGSLAANSAEFHANQKSLEKFQSQFDAVNAFESTAEKNINRLLETAKNIPDLGSRFANVPVRAISEKMLGTENMARFKADLLTAQNEAAKVLNSANMTGVLSDSARKELQDLADGNLSYKALSGAFDEIKGDMGRRKQSYQEQISDIKRRLGDTGQPSSQPEKKKSGGFWEQFPEHK